MSDVFYCVKKKKHQSDLNNLMMFSKLSAAEVKGQMGVEVQGQFSWVGLLNQIFYLNESNNADLQPYVRCKR